MFTELVSSHSLRDNSTNQLAPYWRVAFNSVRLFLQASQFLSFQLSLGSQALGVMISASYNWYFHGNLVLSFLCHFCYLVNKFYLANKSSLLKYFLTGTHPKFALLVYSFNKHVTGSRCTKHWGCNDG